MKTTLTIAGVPYDGTGRPKARVGALDLVLDLDNGYDSLSFTADGCGPTLPFPAGSPVTLSTANDDGSNPQVRFVGDLLSPRAAIPGGWTFGYSASDLRARGDRCALFGPDGSDTARFNLAPDDPLYDASKAGRTVGQIVMAILQGPRVVAQLVAAGVGNYTNGHLPSQTVADLALLAIVPNSPVRLGGRGIFAQLAEFVQQDHPRAILRVQPTGLIRVFDVTNLPGTLALTPPGDSAGGDPVDGLDYTIDLSDSYGAYQVAGLDVGMFAGSIVDKTISPAWSSDDQDAWTIQDWLTPTTSSDQGTASSVGATSCTVKSDNPAAYWSANYLQSIGAVIDLIDPVNGQSITVSEQRVITSCTALAAGGTATITWDSSQPLNSSGYTRYYLVGKNTPRAEVGRRFHVVEPKTGNLDLQTAVGSSLYPIFPVPIWWANNGNLQQITTPAAIVQWAVNGDGQFPYWSLPVGVQLDTTNGQILFSQPVPYNSSATFDQLSRGYPTSEALGLPHDVRVALPYVRGQINALAPATGYAGTAATKYGRQALWVEPRGDFTYAGDQAFWNAYAAEQLLVLQDAVIEGAIRWHGPPDPQRLDPLSMGYALTLATPGVPNPDLDGVRLPVRRLRVSWPGAPGDPDPVRLDYEFSTKRRRSISANFQNHRTFGGGTFGLQGGADAAFGADAAAILGGGAGFGIEAAPGGFDFDAGEFGSGITGRIGSGRTNPADRRGAEVAAARDAARPSDPVLASMVDRVGKARPSAKPGFQTDPTAFSAFGGLPEDPEAGPGVVPADPGRDVAADLLDDVRPRRDDPTTGMGGM